MFDLLAPAGPPVRAMALHALAYCERLFYLEEVEEIRVQDDRVFAGRRLHAALEAEQADEEGESVAVELSSESLGLHGKVDALKRRDGSYQPYEHKRGKPARNQDGEPEAWPSDRLQVIAYALLLEDAFGKPVAEGRIRYHAANVTVRVPIDFVARNDLDDALTRARDLRSRTDRPPIARNPRLCERCSLAPVCLPEEVRQAREPERDPRRLFPPDRDGATLHIVAHGTKVGVSADTLTMQPHDAPAVDYPMRGVESVMLHGHAQISTQALRRCAEHDIGVHWLTMTGRHVGSFTAGAGQVQRRVRQYRALADEATCLRLARQLAGAKVEGQYRYLLRASRGDEVARAAVQRGLDSFGPLLQRIPTAADRDALRGLEGSAAAAYFEGLRALVAPQVPDTLRAANRNRRPPLDRFNALLSYGYGLLHAAAMRALLASGLEPALGFFHTPRSAAHPLALDLMELFRVTVWDMPLLGSLNRLQWHPDDDFDVTKAKVWLSEAGRRKAIGLFEARLQERWKHPVLNYSLSYARTIELEARLLEKEWSGEPGLFARSRLH